MAVASKPSAKIEEAQKLSAQNPQAAESIYKNILSSKPGTTEGALREYEAALIGLGEVYRAQSKTTELADLVKSSTSSLSSFTKAKTAKLVRQLLDLFTTIPNTTDIQISTTKSCIAWAVTERRSFLRQSLETRLVSLHMAKHAYYDALTLINSLLKELKRLDDKLVLVEVQLLESRVYHALGNQPKARAALTAARTSAASVYTPPLLQAGLDMQSGMLHAEDQDFNTAFSYFIEALEGYSSQSQPTSSSTSTSTSASTSTSTSTTPSSTDPAKLATSALQYMLLCKIMLNATPEITALLSSKPAQKHSSPALDAMKAIATAHSARSLSLYETTLSDYKAELFSDPFVKSHLIALYDSMLEANLTKVIEPFSRVEIAHVAKMVGLDEGQVERKLSQMILDKVVVGVLDQEEGCLVLFEEGGRDGGFEAAVETIGWLGGVVDGLFKGQASLLE